MGPTHSASALLRRNQPCRRPEQHALAARILADAPDAVLHTGDVVYESGTPDEVRCHYFVPYADLLPTAPVYLALGNHDQVVDEGAALLSSVRLPTNPVDGTERFYSVDVGPCHVLVLDTDRSVDPGTPEGLLAALTNVELVPGRASYIVRTLTPISKLVNRARGNRRVAPAAADGAGPVA